MLPNSGSAARHSKANTGETGVGWKGKAALFRRPATWREGRLVSKNEFQKFCLTMKSLKGRIIWGRGQSLHYLPLCADFFLIGWWWGNRAGEWSSSNTVLSLKLPSSTWVGALVPAEELKDIVIYIPWGGTRTLPHYCTVVSWLRLLCFFLLPW